MGKATGFLEFPRRDATSAAPLVRIRHFNEFKTPLSAAEQQKQGARCMACGVPFCQYGGSIGGMAAGCPLHNLVPETNDFVYHGNWQQAYKRLAKTHSFPEFTSRVCPALCEAACTCGLNDAPVSTKENERAIIERAFAAGWVQPQVPEVRSGKRVAIVGSGPSGLAAAQVLNRRGHLVTVYEKNDKVGGLLRYGIPNMKLEKWVIDRRVALMEAEGVRFETGVDVGRDLKASQLLKQYDAVLLACGAGEPRNIDVPGRDADGILFAVDFLSAATRALVPAEDGVHLVADPKAAVTASVKGHDVLVIGGGDTGNDCVGTAVRMGARSVLQLEMMPEPPLSRTPDNPWPEWPKLKKTDYGQEEAAAVFGADPRRYQTTVSGFVKDAKGHISQAKLVRLTPEQDTKTGRTRMVPVKDSETTIDVQLVLIAAGFLGPQPYVAKAFKTATGPRSTIQADDQRFATSVRGVFACGDCRRGQSLVVWAIHEGREAARAVDSALMGYSNL